MTPTTRSQSTNDTIMQAIDHVQESLKNMNNDITIVKDALQDLCENIISLHKKKHQTSSIASTP
jgi:hypothetical protein